MSQLLDVSYEEDGKAKLTLPDKGKKFNARKETAAGEEYYGIKIFRFYIVRLTPYEIIIIMIRADEEEMYSLQF